MGAHPEFYGEQKGSRSQCRCVRTANIHGGVSFERSEYFPIKIFNFLDERIGVFETILWKEITLPKWRKKH